MKKLFTALFVFALVSQAYAELPKGFVYLSDVNSSVVQEIRYHSSHNFVGTRVDGYVSPVCILTRQAAAGSGQGAAGSRTDRLLSQGL
ncbi:MAG: hypothetical protein LRY51_02725 [Geovibrio sp.]|nr:hypothetical protein [Geovibrio sp.]